MHVNDIILVTDTYRKHPTRSRVYMDVPLPKSVHSSNQHLDRDPCLRYNQIQHT